MQTVVSVDVAKGKSVFGIYSLGEFINPDKKNLGMSVLHKPKEIKHTQDGLAAMTSAMNAVGAKTVLMESTGGYHINLCNRLRAKGYDVIVFNPSFTSLEKTTLRKTKTDKKDVEKIAVMYFKGDYNRSMARDAENESAMRLSRHIEDLTKQASVLKNNLRSDLELVFPEMEEYFGEVGLFGEGILTLLMKFVHPARFKKANRQRIISCMGRICPQHLSTYEKYADDLISLAKNSFGTTEEGSSLVEDIIPSIARSLLMLGKEIKTLREKLSSMTSECELKKILLSFTGIGENLASSFVAEIGDISLYQSAKKITAMAGLDPSKEQSGTSIDRVGKITKHGNRHLRHILFNMVSCMIMQSSRLSSQNDITEYYKKKRNDGKHHYAAVTACCNKLIRKIYYRYKEAVA